MLLPGVLQGLHQGGTCPSTPRCVFLLLLPSSPGLVAAFVRRLRCRHLFSSSLDPHSFRCLVSLFPFDRSTLIHHQLGPPSATPAVLIIHRPVPRHNTTTTSDSDSRKFPICNKGYIPAGDNWRVGFYHGCVTERSLVCTTESHFDRCNHHSIYLVPQLPAHIVFRPAFFTSSKGPPTYFDHPPFPATANKMIFPLYAVVGLLVGQVVSQAALSPCAAGCVDGVLANTSKGGCAVGDTACVCRQASDVTNGVRDCIAASCAAEGAEQLTLGENSAKDRCAAAVAAASPSAAPAAPATTTTPAAETPTPAPTTSPTEAAASPTSTPAETTTQPASTSTVESTTTAAESTSAAAVATSTTATTLETSVVSSSAASTSATASPTTDVSC